MLPEPSNEQRKIVEAIANHNVVVDSVAGSGKTTTNLYMAYTYPQAKILLLTYNKRLKDETRKRAKENNLNNLEVHSYHSFCVKYYNRKCFNDDVLKKVVTQNVKPLRNFVYNCIIVDEVQDMKAIYYLLVKKIYNDNKNILHATHICIVGDRHQCIYKKMGADPKYITNAEVEFAFNQLPWKRLKLSQSFRLTHEMAQFVNRCLMHEEKIQSSRKGPKVRYFICDIYREPRLLVDELLAKYKPDDIFIISPAIKHSYIQYGGKPRPINVLENHIKTNHKDVLVYVTNDEDVIDQDIINKKLVISSIHQTKGLERKIVVYLGFDNSYYTFIDKQAPKTRCPNEIYVATTRAKYKLYVLHAHPHAPLPFIKTKDILDTCKVITYDPFKGKYSAIDNLQTLLNIFDRLICVMGNNNYDRLASDIAKFATNEIIDKCYSYLEIEQLRIPGKEIVLNGKTSQGDYYESVCDINGILMPLAYSYVLQGKEINLSTLVKEALKIWRVNTGQMYKEIQIHDFNWLSTKEINDCIARIDSLDDFKNASFEHCLPPVLLKYDNANVRLHGIVDCMNGNRIYEFKCVKTLQKEHFLQLMAYAYMCRNKDYFLYNIVNDELYKVSCSDENLKTIIDILIKHSINYKE